MTFSQLALFVYRHHDCAVDTDLAYVQNTREYAIRSVYRLNSMKRTGTDLRKSPDAAMTKKIMAQVVEKIKNNDTLKPGTAKEYSKLQNKYS